jgi:TRAP-type C4-dicarboxylate transport system permease small subunit
MSAIANDAIEERPAGHFTQGIHIFFGGLSGIFLFLLMMLSVVDVIGRELLSAPVPGGSEMTEILMAALIYAGLPSVCRQESHVTIDLLDPVTPASIVRPRQVLVNLVCAGILAIMAWHLWLYADKIAGYGDVTEYLRIPQSPLIYYMSVLAGIGALIFLVNVARYVRGHTTPAPGLI